MYEVFSTIHDDYGTRVVPTGKSAFLEVTAYEIMERMKAHYPEDWFHVEWVPSADAWNQY